MAKDLNCDPVSWQFQFLRLGNGHIVGASAPRHPSVKDPMNEMGLSNMSFEGRRPVGGLSPERAGTVPIMFCTGECSLALYEVYIIVCAHYEHHLLRKGRHLVFRDVFHTKKRVFSAVLHCTLKTVPSPRLHNRLH